MRDEKRQSKAVSSFHPSSLIPHPFLRDGGPLSEPEAVLPPRVSRFEANLLDILRFFLRRMALERVQKRIIEECPRPKCLSRAAVRLAEDMLAKGCVSLLARAGGWRRERYLRGAGVV